MITPCNAGNGSGMLTPTVSRTISSAFAPAGEIGLSQMTDVAPGQSQRSRSAAAAQQPSPMPSQSGIIASTVPIPGTVPPSISDLPETIPGQPDPPFVQNSNPALVQSTDGVNPPPVLPDAPQFPVPQNPLLPPGYQEYISYENLQYLNGFLRTQIGKYVRIEQLVGSNMTEERYGYLIGVGINYVLLQELGTGNVSALDYYNIKFVHIYYTNPSIPSGSPR